MRVVHSGILVSSLEHAREFFENLLGLTCSRKYTVPGDLMNELFGLKRSYNVRIYDIGDQKIEVFISPRDENQKEGSREGSGEVSSEQNGKSPDSIDQNPTVSHLCIGVNDRESLIERARDQGFRVYERDREGKPNLVFIYDRDGNPFEIMEDK